VANIFDGCQSPVGAIGGYDGREGGVTDTPLSASTPRAAVGFFEEETLLAVCLVFQHALNVQFSVLMNVRLGTTVKFND
jgi:hypothetical protein